MTATDTRDLPDREGSLIPSQWVQASALAELGDRFATVVQDSGDLPGARCANWSDSQTSC
ncbi:hypothetical protein JRI60_13465 [Archangium violaceum]|uniref:hypothetical protein n=1 Tax=Archangium violaceum TaxID=83451 RepID=UPI00194EAFD7|nr:hypothetical protein [Archangium violaceum]QRN99959.1 hypothetical protein JRI60_13465 [Archangium violaceum]